MDGGYYMEQKREINNISMFIRLLVYKSYKGYPIFAAGLRIKPGRAKLNG